MNIDYLELYSELLGSLFIKIQRETPNYYFINQYPTLGLIPVIGILRATKETKLLQLDKKKNYNDIGFKIINKVNIIPSRINTYRIYD